MRHMRYWLSSKRRQMAKLHDLQRQLQEAWDTQEVLSENFDWAKNRAEKERGDCKNALGNLATQLHRVARERDKERELRLDTQLRLAAEELRNVYLEQLANEEE